MSVSPVSTGGNCSVYHTKKTHALTCYATINIICVFNFEVGAVSWETVIKLSICIMLILSIVTKGGFLFSIVIVHYNVPLAYSKVMENEASIKAGFPLKTSTYEKATPPCVYKFNMAYVANIWCQIHQTVKKKKWRLFHQCCGINIKTQINVPLLVAAIYKANVLYSINTQSSQFHNINIY